jgi:hypothetical protein
MSAQQQALVATGSVTMPSSNRYWRLKVTANYLQTFTVIAEVDMFVSGVEPTYTGTAIETNGFGSGFEPSKAFDNTNSTSWASAANQGANCSVGFDFGAGNEKAVTSFGIRARDINGSQAPKSFQFQGSPDNSTWYTYATYTNEPSWSNGEYRTYAFN